jgi:hypothetical protein
MRTAQPPPEKCAEMARAKPPNPPRVVSVKPEAVDVPDEDEL